MKRMMVLGAAGGMGIELVRELLQRGYSVVAAVRSETGKKRIQTALQLPEGDPKIERLWFALCDVRNADELAQAARGCDVLFNSLGLPYADWYDGWKPLLNAVLYAAKTADARIVQVDNVYPYGYSRYPRVAEDHPKNPHTRKGKIRLQLEQKLMDAHSKGIPVLIARFPDFYGATARQSMLNMTLQQWAQGMKATYVGPPHVAREFIYVPDGAKAAVELALQEIAYGENWNIAGAGTITGLEIAAIASEITGKPCKLKPVGKKMMAVAGLFNRSMRELVELMYLMEKPVILDGNKYERAIGPIPQTDYRTGIRHTLQSFMQAQAGNGKE